MGKTIIVSNRLPLQVSLRNEEIEVEQSVGGLATGLKSIHDEGNSIWIGWSGITEEELNPELSQKINKELRAAKCDAVHLNQDEIDKFYLGFSNKSLWPLFHYFMEYAEFDSSEWEAYKAVNQKFADKVLEKVEDGDRIWIHDYQLMLVPKMIRDKNPDVAIGFFLHIPFPSYEIFRTFPWREELLKGMLGADLIGFHTYDYERHFMSSVKRILNLEVKYSAIKYRDKTVRVSSFPMGIDFDKFYNAALRHKNQDFGNKSSMLKRLEDHIETSEEAQLIISIDRMDYTKGIPNRIKAFEHFLNKYPQFKEKVHLIMLTVPSRSNVPQYQLLKRETDELVGQINGKFSTVNWTPIWYFYRSMPFENLIDLYVSSDVALINPLRDGMNLVAKEFVASRVNQDGVLVLSEMAGAAKEMSEALLINPSNFEQIADTLKLALEMPVEEQKSRMNILQKRLKFHSVEKWAEDFLIALDDTRNKNSLFEYAPDKKNITAKTSGNGAYKKTSFAE